MKNKLIWLFIINLFGVYTASAQEEATSIVNTELASSTWSEEEVEKLPRVYALRVGLDIYKPVTTQFDENYQGLELVGDLKLNRRWYVAAEIGSEKKTIQSDLFNFTTNGSYIKLGVDYNFFNNWKGMNNALYLGFRLARSLHTQKVNNYTLYQLSQYIPLSEIVQGYATGERSSLSNSWYELLFGIKVQLLKNFYAGISIRMHGLISNPQPNNFGNLYAPGFNKITDDNNFGGSFNYTLTYTFPFQFRKKKD